MRDYKKTGAGLSRREKILNILNKEPGRKFIVQEILDKLGFNSDSATVKNILKILVKECKINCEELTTPQGKRTFYYVNIQSDSGNQ